MGSHPEAVVQYTFTHKQYTERHKTDNIYRTIQKFWKSAKLIATFRNFANAPKSLNGNNDETLVAPAERSVLIFTSDLKNVSVRN